MARSVGLKVFGYINLMRAMFAHMRGRPPKVILNVMGMGADRPQWRYVCGNAGNVALNGVTKSLGGRSLDHGVRVLGVNPGAVETERMKTLLQSRAEKMFGDASRWREVMASTQPHGRAATTKEIADVVCFWLRIGRLGLRRGRQCRCGKHLSTGSFLIPMGVFRLICKRIGRPVRTSCDKKGKAMLNRLADISRALRRLPLLFFALVTASSAATAQGYPNKPIHIIVPYAPGGVVDATARMLAERLNRRRQTFIIENKAGGAGKIAAEFVSRAEPDGYTILYTTAADLTLLQGRPSTAEAIRNLTPITSAISPVGAITARSGLGLDSMEKLLAYVKSNPGKLTYGTAGYGSSQHLIGEHFKQQGYEMVHVPFNGIAPAMAALAGGQIDLAITNLASSLPLAEDGKRRSSRCPNRNLSRARQTPADHKGNARLCFPTALRPLCVLRPAWLASAHRCKARGRNRKSCYNT